MIKEAGLESSNITDSEHGLPVFVSTTARKFFREQFSDHAKTRNWVVNQYLAGMFVNGSPISFFRPKKGDDSEVGEIRMAGGGKFIGIIGNDHVRIIAVKGGLSGALPALSPQAAPPEQQGQGQQMEMFSPDRKPEQMEMSQQQQGVEEALQGTT